MRAGRSRIKLKKVQPCCRTESYPMFCLSIAEKSRFHACLLYFHLDYGIASSGWGGISYFSHVGCERRKNRQKITVCNIYIYIYQYPTPINLNSQKSTQVTTWHGFRLQRTKFRYSGLCGAMMQLTASSNLQPAVWALVFGNPPPRPPEETMKEATGLELHLFRRCVAWILLIYKYRIG